MASAPSGPPLDSAPPAPTAPGMSAGQLVAGPGAATSPGGDSAQPQAVAQQLVRMGAEVDRALMAISQVAVEGQKEFAQARQLISAGLAKHLSQVGGGADLSTSPTAPGTQFPGGGFSGNR